MENNKEKEIVNVVQMNQIMLVASSMRALDDFIEQLPKGYQIILDDKYVTGNNGDFGTIIVHERYLDEHLNTPKGEE